MKEMENTQVVRHLNLEKMTRSIEKEKFQDEYKPYYGLYDNDGLESFVKIDDIYNVACLDTLTASIKSLKLRARFNSQRSAEVYLCWLMPDDVVEIEDALNHGEYTHALTILKEVAIFV